MNQSVTVQGCLSKCPHYLQVIKRDRTMYELPLNRSKIFLCAYFRKAMLARMLMSCSVLPNNFFLFGFM